MKVYAMYIASIEEFKIMLYNNHITVHFIHNKAGSQSITSSPVLAHLIHFWFFLMLYKYNMKMTKLWINLNGIGMYWHKLENVMWFFKNKC